MSQGDATQAGGPGRGRATGTSHHDDPWAGREPVWGMASAVRALVTATLLQRGRSRCGCRQGLVVTVWRRDPGTGTARRGVEWPGDGDAAGQGTHMYRRRASFCLSGSFLSFQTRQESGCIWGNSISSRRMPDITRRSRFRLQITILQNFVCNSVFVYAKI